MARLLYEGHASFRLISDSGFTIYIDPYVNENCSEPADLVLVTHEHFDHNQLDVLAMKPQCTILRPAVTLLDGEYQLFTIDDIDVLAVPAHNSHHPLDECVGYIVDIDGRRLYFAGDTSTTPFMSEEMPQMRIDYAFLPCDGKFNMDLDEAMECARKISAAHTVPIHTCPVSPGEKPRFDEKKAMSFDVPGALVVRPGEEIVL